MGRGSCDDAQMPMSGPPSGLLPGAEPFFAEGGSVGVLLCHGFTGSPQSLRPWAEHLAAAGLTVSLPLLPGHGTRWQDLRATGWPDWYAALDDAYAGLRARAEQVFVMGLSMGGTLALRLAEQHGADVGGLVLVNPSLRSTRRLLALLPLVRRVLPTVPGALPGPAQDIKRPGAREVAYPRMPLDALASLVELWEVTGRDLHRVVSPVLLLRSVEDHVVEPASARRLLRCIGSRDVEERVLADSYHVATLDNDAGSIFAASLDFVSRLSAPSLSSPSLSSPSLSSPSRPGRGLPVTPALDGSGG